MKRFLHIFAVLLVSLVLAGCGDPAEKAYNESVELGTEYLAAADLENAEEQFKIALENKPEDEFVQNILDQIRLYQEATDEFNNENNEQALELAKKAANISEGSEVLNEKAETLKEEIQNKIDAELAEQKAREEEEARIKAEKEKEAAEQARKEEEARIQAEKEAAEKEAAEAAAAQATSYNDFKGMYGLYEGSTLTAVIIFSNQYMTDIYTDWNHVIPKEIASTHVEGGVLYLDYLGEAGEMSPVTWEPGSFQGKLNRDENGRKVITTSAYSLYQMDQSEFDALGYTINSPEIFEGF